MAALAFGGHFVAAPALGLSRLAVNDYKGASYARRLPEAKKVFESYSPFGLLEAYTTSYLHFAPGLSDNAGFNLPTMPANAYMGLYIDSDGPIGVMRHLDAKESAYFRFLPMYYPYVIKKQPKTFITQFGGGISTEVALRSGSKDVTVAEGNRAILAAFRDPVFKDFTGDILSKVRVIDYEGRHFLAQTKEKFDVIDLSLADSTGLSNPGGFAVVEKFAYTQEAMETYMRALSDGGVLAVTIWNKEEPPKSVLKLYATMAAASRAHRRRRAWPIRSSSRRPISRPRRCSTSAADSPRTRSTSFASIPMTCRSTKSIRRAFSTTARRPIARWTAMSRSSSPRRSMGRPLRADRRPRRSIPPRPPIRPDPQTPRRRPMMRGRPAASPTMACCPRP